MNWWPSPPGTVPPSVGRIGKAVQRSFGCLSKLSGFGNLGTARHKCIEVRDFTKSVFKPLVFCALAQLPLAAYAKNILRYTNIFTKSMPVYHCFEHCGSFKGSLQNKTRGSNQDLVDLDFVVVDRLVS